MRCASNRVHLEEVGDFFDPRTLARLLGIAEGKAYQLVKRKGFPALRVGRRWVINKAAFIEWFNSQQKQKPAL
ncbi:MAG: helix-turn-helix domain-containing protein [Thermacetogeniaceae bacterium]